MATTLLDWNALENRLKSYVEQFDQCPDKRNALSYLVIEQVLEIGLDEIEDAITDGSNDRGIDAVHIEDNDGATVVHLFQFKHVEEFKKAKNSFPSSEIDKLLSFVAGLLDKDEGMESTCNPLLWNKVKEIWAALEKAKAPTFEIHFCGNLERMTDAQCERVEKALRDYRHFAMRYHTLRTIVDNLIDAKRKQIDATMRVVDKNYFERTDGNIRGLIATVEGAEIVSLLRDPASPKQVRKDVLNDNVRVYLTKKNRVNQKILQSALSSENREFWYLNNGITMTCDSFSYQPGARAPSVQIKNVQIVNGGQTSNALFEAAQKSEKKVKDVLVLIRLYETKTTEISAKIAESTNSQTPINSRDLRSNDDVQKRLEQAFEGKGLFYERKSKQFSDKPRANRIDALTLAQAFLAYELDLPEVAKKDRARVFSDLYDTVFTDTLTVEKLLLPYRVLQAVEREKREIKRKIRKGETFDTRKLYLIDGAYHVLYAVAQLGDRRANNATDEALAVKRVPDAIELIAQAVEAAKAVDPAFTFNRFFKDPKTKHKLDTLLPAPGGK